MPVMIFVILVCLGFSASPGKANWQKIQINGAAQGTSYQVIYYSIDTAVTKKDIDGLLDNIDSSLSLYKEYSLINQFNRSARGIKADSHLRRVVSRGLEVFRQTNGLFDMTVAPLTFAWGFGPAGKGPLPDSTAIRKLLGCVDSRLLFFRRGALCKRISCVQIDLNGIAQGYSVDLLAGLLEQHGVHNYLVELGGEIRVKGRKQPGGQKMSVGIETPGDDPEFSVVEQVIWPGEGAVTTSGNYRRFYESGGRKISHLLDPRTGFPAQGNLLSVTVYAKDAMTADAFDNALMLMGLDDAMKFVEARKDIAAHFIYLDSQRKVADTMSSAFRVLLQP